MSHQRYASHDPVKEPHSISLKVLRLSRPSLVTQHPIASPLSPPSSHEPPLAASLAYEPSAADTNPSPFLLSPVLNFPASFGSAYVGEVFSCTLCANNDLPTSDSDGSSSKKIRDVRIEAEMKTPGTGAVHKLDMKGASVADGGQDLAPGQTLQGVVTFDLKEEGNHVLAVTVSYYEATETSGRTRTFRKLYQFICKSSIIVRTKIGPLRKPTAATSSGPHSWVLEAQLENCSEVAMQLEKVVMNVDDGLRSRDCNWDTERPVLHPGEIEQVCFVVEEKGEGTVPTTEDGKVVFGVLGIGWRGEMGSRGYLATGKLGTRVLK